MESQRSSGIGSFLPAGFHIPSPPFPNDMQGGTGSFPPAGFHIPPPSSPNDKVNLHIHSHPHSHSHSPVTSPISPGHSHGNPGGFVSPVLALTPGIQSQTDLEYDYELPKTIEAVRQGWVTSAQAYAVVSTLLVGVNSALFSLFNEDNARELWVTNRHPYNFLLVAAYGTFFLTLGATVSSLILIDLLSETAMHAYKKERSKRLAQELKDAFDEAAPKEGSHHHLHLTDSDPQYSTWVLLQTYGGETQLHLIFLHCTLSLIAGLLGICAQLGAWLWIQQRDRLQVAIPVTLTIFWCFAPVFLVWILPFFHEFGKELGGKQPAKTSA